MQEYRNSDCCCRKNPDPLEGLPLAMGYVPWQSFHHTMELCKALNTGTIFPELCKPFCGRGKRGGCL